MDIKVEVSLTPEELRRFLGLPDVGGLQDDLIDFVRDKMSAASGATGDFDASGFVKANFDNLRKAGFSTFLKRARPTENDQAASGTQTADKPKAPSRKASSRGGTQRKARTTKKRN